MKYARAIAFAMLAGATIISTGCSVARDQQTVGSYMDDTGITTAVKAKMAKDGPEQDAEIAAAPKPDTAFRPAGKLDMPAL